MTPTMLMTNSPEIARMMEAKCANRRKEDVSEALETPELPPNVFPPGFWKTGGKNKWLFSPFSGGPNSKNPESDTSASES